jgi:methylated-DNA-protein-cysteine methyltransferase-like protein
LADRFTGIAVADSQWLDWIVRKTKEKFRADQGENDTGKMRLRIEAAIRAIPKGKVSTYGGIARIAGFPGAARMVARVLHRGFGLPWQRVLGAGGEIRLSGDSAIEQRLRLEAEGVRFRGRRVDMKTHEIKSSSRTKPSSSRGKKARRKKR